MKLEEFYSKYANTPIAFRYQMLNWKELGKMSLTDLYNEVEKIQRKTFDDRLRLEKLLKEADSFWEKTNE